MLTTIRRSVLLVTAFCLLLTVPGSPAYAAAAAIARGTYPAAPSISTPGRFSLVSLTPLVPTSLTIIPSLLPSLPAAAIPAAAARPAAAALPASPAAAALPAADALAKPRRDPADAAASRSIIFDGAAARPADDGAAVGLDGPTLRKGFIPATVIVAGLEKAAQTDPEQGYAQAVSLIADHQDARREPKLAALRVLAALPISRTLPYYAQTLKHAAADEDSKRWGEGSRASWYIQRAILLRLAEDPQALRGYAEAVAAVQASYQDGNASVRLAAAQALKNAGIEPGPERNDDALAPVTAPSPDLSAPEKPGLLTRLGKMSPWTKALLGITVAATLGLGVTAHFTTPVYESPATPPAIVKVQPDTPATNAPAKAVRPEVKAAQDAVKAFQDAKAQAPVKKLTPAEQSLESIAREIPDLKHEIRALGEKVAAAQAQKEGTGKMSGILQIALFIGGFFLLSSFIRSWAAKKSGGDPNGSDSLNKKGKSIHVRTEPGQNATRFTDVEGMDENLIETSEIVEFLRNPAKFRRLGAHIPRGVLLDGPPGTGKTLTAKALAGEAGVPFFSLSGADFQEMLVGVGSARVRDLMTEARKEKAAIVFIDEIDAIGQARGGVNSNPEQESTLNAILTAMNGFNDNDGIVFIGATNRADLLDKALTRPGRFDRKVHVGLPHMGGREAILAIHAGKSRLSAGLDLRYVARRTTGLAGADLANIMNDAAILAARRGADAVEAQDIDRAVDKATFGDERRMPVPEEIKRRVAFHEAGHVLASLLNEDPALRQKVNKFTMVPHSNGSLGLAEFDSADSFMQTRAQLEARLDVALGGLVAEKLVFGSDKPIPGQWSTGPGNDLEQATKIARAMVQTLGMGRTTGLAVTAAGERDYGRSPFGDQVAAQVHQEVNELLDAAMRRVVARLTRNRHVLEALTAAVLEKETIIGDEIEELIRKAGPVMKGARSKRK